MSTELYRKTMQLGEDFKDPKMGELMKEVWGPTPWMIVVVTTGREQEIQHWCYQNFGPESSPIHRREGSWHRANVTMHGRTWYGFKTEELMKRFQARFSP